MIEFARNVLGLEGANSTEFNPATPHAVVVDMPEISKTHMGGTMRLGKRRTVITLTLTLTLTPTLTLTLTLTLTYAGVCD